VTPFVAALAAIGILALAVGSRDQAGLLAISILVIAVLSVVVFTVHDIVAQRTRSEVGIRDLNEQLVEQKGLVDSLLRSLSNMEVGLMVVVGSRIESVNEAFSRLTGYGGAEGKPLVEITDLIAPEFLEQFRRIRADRAAGMRGVLTEEWEVITSDGRRIPVQSISHTEAIEGEKRAVVLVLDITDRKRVERALAESQARLQAIVDTSLNAIVTMDEDGRISDWNPQAETTFGWLRDEILGKVLADTIIPPRYRDAHRAGVKRYLATGEGPVLGKVLELVAIDKGGREFPVELAISRASVVGAKALFVGFVRDITRRKQAEDAINDLNAELRVAARHKSEFLANMSHELRTPLNAILGFSELLLDDQAGKFDPATRRKFLDQVSTSGRHLLALINDILDLSKVEAGRMTLELQTFPIAGVVDDVLNTIQPLAAKKKILISAGADVGQIEADPGKVQQMLLNLASNAVKFTSEGGVIRIDACRLATAVEISVTDTGLGIAAQDLGRLFKEFEQLDSSASRKQEGTGLGLALTRRLARLHGGDVRVASELGKGSTFTISLPIRQAARLASDVRNSAGRDARSASNVRNPGG
jgi:PAS domain S-box-containing protein